MDALTAELDDVMLPRIRQYSLWSYYNQTSNDIIELFFLKHPAVIPTLRKIHDIDFFLKIDERIIPFDLKFTHISDSYFDLASQGIIRNDDLTNPDNFSINPVSDNSEIKRIKAYYSTIKRSHREYNLPNFCGLDKNELCDLLVSTNDVDAISFVSDIKREHARDVPTFCDPFTK